MPTRSKTKPKTTKKTTSTKQELDTARTGPAPTTLRNVIGLFCNRSYQTVIALEHDDTAVLCLRISMTDGLHLERISVPRFEKEFRPREIEGLEQAARTYTEFTRYLGATDDALARLQSIISLTAEEVAMAKARADERKQATTEKAVKAKAKSAAKKPVAAKSDDKKERKVPSSQVFMALIMEGKLTDDEIFAKVQDQYGLDDKRRSYVGYYRQHLKKKLGKNPPAPVEKK